MICINQNMFRTHYMLLKTGTFNVMVFFHMLGTHICCSTYGQQGKPSLSVHWTCLTVYVNTSITDTIWQYMNDWRLPDMHTEWQENPNTPEAIHIHNNSILMHETPQQIFSDDSVNRNILRNGQTAPLLLMPSCTRSVNIDFNSNKLPYLKSNLL
jgi:hypothetical protein